MKVLVTGGTGYIGSHTVVELLAAGHDVTIIDNFNNSSATVIDRIEQITGKRPACHKIDVRDRDSLQKLIADSSFDTVIHFAALKAVGESAQQPLRYFENNVGGIVSLLQAIQDSTVQRFIFSSSATVYGKAPVPYVETAVLAPTNPYGHQGRFRVGHGRSSRCQVSVPMIALRYFNPIGAHPSGLIGEDPSGVPNNLMPFIAQVASGQREALQIFGNDYPTPDGTCQRDYIHVVDLAKGHVAALEHGVTSGFKAYNLGSGQGTSVLEVIKAFEAANHLTIPTVFAPRRAGDLPVFYADPTLAEQELGWKVQLTLEAACRDAWNWQSQNPSGYTA